MEAIPTTTELFDLSRTAAFPLLSATNYPWEALAGISDFIKAFGKTLPKDEYYSPSENIWIAKSATVAASAYIGAPCIIMDKAEIRHCAYIRGSALVGRGSVVGNSCELKNVILFDNVQVPHFNYVGDSILGSGAHLGAGCITSNIKSDRTNVTVKYGDDRLETGLRKLGAIVGDGVEVGCNSVLNPGTVIGKNSTVYPLSSVRGIIPENSIYKGDGKITGKDKR